MSSGSKLSVLGEVRLVTRWFLVIVTLVIFMRSGFDLLATCWCLWQGLYGWLRGVNLHGHFLQLILYHTKNLSERYASMNHANFFCGWTSYRSWWDGVDCHPALHRSWQELHYPSAHGLTGLPA